MEASRDELRGFFETVLPHLNEVQRRVVAGAMAAVSGRGGRTAVAEVSGLGRNTVTKGEREVAAGIEPSERLRAPGAGDKPAIDKQPGLLEALDELVWPETRGHPESPLRWTLTSTYEWPASSQRGGIGPSNEPPHPTPHPAATSRLTPTGYNHHYAHCHSRASTS